MPTGKRHNIDDLRSTIDFAIITMRDDEYLAVLDRFPAPDTAENERRYGIGEMETIDGQHYHYALVRCTKQGQQEAQSVTNAVIKDLDPNLLLLVGICGAVPSDDFTLGDVLCATRVNDYSVGKVQEGQAEKYNIDGGGMEVRIRNLLGDLPRIARTLPEWNTGAAVKTRVPAVEVPEWDPQTKQYSHADKLYGNSDWQERVIKSLQRHFPENTKARLPLATAQAVASSNRVIKATLPIEQWSETAYSLAGIEMELAGVYTAARTAKKEYPILAIRGISDVVGFKRKDEWTKFACAVAAAFAYSLVCSGELLEILGPRGETTGRGRARRELEQRGINFNHESLYTHIRAANPEIVRLLLTGLTANIETEGGTPLELCLRMIEKTVENTADHEFALDAHHIQVLEAILSAPEPPRDVVKKLHEALEQECPARLIALLRAGAPVHLADRSGFTLLQKAMARDEARGDNGRNAGPWPTLTETLIRESRTIDDDSLCLALLWSAAWGLVRVADAALSRECPVDARLDDRPPPWPVTPEQLKFFWPGGTALHFAVRSSANVVAFLLEHHATLDVRNRAGNAPLHEAVQDSRSHTLEIVRLLLQAGADPNIRDSARHTPLHLLVLEYECPERVELVRLLLQKGAEAEAADADRRGPLDLYRPNKRAFVEQLLDAGATLTPGRCAALLHGATRAKYKSHITRLIQRGIDVNARDENGETALHTLVGSWGYSNDGFNSRISEDGVEQSRACLDELLRLGIDVTAMDRNGQTALHVIAWYGDEEVINRIIDAGADPNARTHIGLTPLMRCRTASAVRLLIARGGDPNSSDSFGYSVYDLLTIQKNEEAARALAETIQDVKLSSQGRLLLALKGKNRDGVRALLQSGVDPNSLNEHGEPILFTAIAMGDATIVGDLLDYGASPHTTDSYGNLAIHAAVRAGCVETVKRLLSHGVNLEVRNRNGMTPLGAALSTYYKDKTSGQYERMVSFILDCDASVLNVDGEGNAAAFCALWWWSSEALARRLMEACLHERSTQGDTLLHGAAYLGQHEEFHWLLHAGLDINTQNNKSQSPLHKLLSGFCSDPELAIGIKALIQAGARVDVQDCFGDTPLHLAVCQKSLVSVETLLQAGANPKAKNSTGFTPIDEALRIVETILARANPKITGLTPINEALRIEDVDILQVLWNTVKACE